MFSPQLGIGDRGDAEDIPINNTIYDYTSEVEHNTNITETTPADNDTNSAIITAWIIRNWGLAHPLALGLGQQLVVVMACREILIGQAYELVNTHWCVSVYVYILVCI